jgi:cytochrome c peroxidase
MRRLQGIGFVCSSFGGILGALLVGTWISGPSVAAHTDHRVGGRSPWEAARSGRLPRNLDAVRARLRAAQSGNSVGKEGRRLFEEETFGGNGRTCLTCHSRETGTVSPADAAARFAADPADPLFLADGSDNGGGAGVSRMLADATILMNIPLASNVTLQDDPDATLVVVPRGIPTTLNTPALDPVLMLDGRQPTLISQATGAIHDHAHNTVEPTLEQLTLIEKFQKTETFFTSPALRNFAHGAAAPKLPLGTTASERRGRRFFEDIPPDATGKDGLCAGCHAGPMLNETNLVLQQILGVEPGTRFQSVLVSELNMAGNPLKTFVFNNPDGSTSEWTSPDLGRALISGMGQESGKFDHINAFKISTLWGVKKTAPYFHDNSAKTLEAMALHYREFFLIVSGGFLFLDDQDIADMVAFLKLL